MEKKFGALRLKDFTRLAVAGSAVLGAAHAEAVSVTATGHGAIEVDAGDAVWHINNNITFATPSSNWGFSEGSLVTSATLRTDAFDGALSWRFSTDGGATYPSDTAHNYVSPGGTVDVSPAFPTSASTATTVTGSTQTIDGLSVTGQLYFATNKAVARSLLTMYNPTGAAITVTVQSANNLGSDSNTYIQMTSSGDQTVDASDTWFVSSQGQPLIARDPVLTFAYGQAGAFVATTGDDNPAGTFTVTVPAGGTRSLMVFVQMSGTVAGAVSDAAVFNSNSTLQASAYLSGLSATQQTQIVNWALTPTTTTTEIPTLGEWAMLALMGVVGAAGIAGLSRRGRGMGAAV